MEYPANMLDSTKSCDEKHSFEDVEIQTRSTTSAANVARYISEKLSYWGVEERGAYLYHRFPRSTLNTVMNGLLCLSLDRYSPCRCRGQNRNAFHQDILFVVVRHFEHVVVRVHFFKLRS